MACHGQRFVQHRAAVAAPANRTPLPAAQQQAVIVDRARDRIEKGGGPAVWRVTKKQLSHARQTRLVPLAAGEQRRRRAPLQADGALGRVPVHAHRLARQHKSA
ncbi:MAG: hypothetical protein CL678_00370 [Bdellovibrionaceae bacterium]|nr:hypothetical protein [Pseudobdellovibrionaceae bacterium]